ncbi:G-protein coupled receptor Mth2-like isoform X2 [Coccinella septempunctata]|uniref:G-protein coupled receptor Mth2-like isoform X2 n=1 Tax=Coccinella septempunctata TaxID=41139 RepID=UPI001D09915C|nr:G-protein coupled receptor Mth2-like isoform X2 [Coccinella septempunctata]
MLFQHYSPRMCRLIVLILVVCVCQTSGVKACAKGDLVQDITDGFESGSVIVKDNVRYESHNFYREGHTIWGCVCEVTKCLRKCCQDGFSPVRVGKDRICKPSSTPKQLLSTSLRENVHTKDYKLFHAGFICDTPDTLALRETNLDKDLNGGFLNAFGMSLGVKNFCLDHVQDRLTSIICVTTEEELVFKSVGMIISMPFLLVTFLVYALLPDRNLHMKALMCYVINLLHAYIFLVTIQLTDEVFEDTVCAILGYCCVFFFLASFFWMNVICVDIFLGFRGFRGVPGVRSSERKRFILYCIYAWGMSLLIVFITFMVNHFGNVGQWFYPGVAVGQCFIRNGIPQLLYFYGPMGIIIILNVVLFTLTAMRIRRVKKDTAMLKHSESKRHSDDDQQNFNLYLKLLLAMGVNWSMELVSWAVNLNNKAVPQYVWYLSDFCNATYGVFIFFIFVFKRNIWKQLRRRYYSFMGRHHMAHSMGTTNFTKTTNDSMTVSTNDRALEESELNGTRIN